MFTGISTKLILTFLIVSLMIIVVGIFIYRQTGIIVSSTDQLSQTLLQMHDAAWEVREAVLEEEVALEQVHRLDEGIAMENFQNARTKMTAAIRVLQDISLIDKSDLDSLSLHEHDFRLLVENMFAVQQQLSMAGHKEDHQRMPELSAEHALMMRSIDNQAQQLRELLIRLDSRSRQVTADRRGKSRETMSNVRESQFLLLSSGVIFTIFMGMLAQRRIARPVKKLTEEVKLIGSGNFDRRIHTGGADEVKDLEDVFNKMVDDLQRNIRRHTELQVELLERQKHAMSGRFAQGLARNLRSQLVHIRLASGRLEKGEHPPIESAIIDTAARNLENSIAGLVSDDRRDAGREESPIDLNVMIAEELSLVGLGDDFGSGITTRCHLAEDLPGMNARYADLSQMFSILLQNARDAMDRSAEKVLTISTRYDPVHIFIEVGDSGNGIPDEHLPKLFDPFFTTKVRGGTQAEGERSGSGLGLWSLRELLHPYGGTIIVKSKVGVGSTFTIKIPHVRIYDREDCV